MYTPYIWGIYGVYIPHMLLVNMGHTSGSHNDPQPLASGHYGCPQANTKAIPLQAIINI